MQIRAGQFLCAGAVLESHRLAMGVPADTRVPICPKMIPRHANIEPKVSRSGPKASQDAPMQSQVPQSVPQGIPMAPQGVPKRAQGSPKRNKRNAMQAPKDALALYIHKNSRSTAPAATMLFAIFPGYPEIAGTVCQCSKNNPSPENLTKGAARPPTAFPG